MSNPEPPTVVGEQAGDRIDRYELVREIGEGGMGTVWLSTQSEPVKREVALKVVKLGMDTREVVARFEAERQALAMMDHPHIAKVLDGGATATGRPFFVMELVDGIPITEHCERERLDLKSRLELFAKVCDGVHHAHQKGLIHRDLKPGNVLVANQDGEPVPKVIDFGIAKATGSEAIKGTMQTESGQVLGTPEYMAPEQASFDDVNVDTRADVYSLGALLYEMLTGTKPFDLQAALEGGFDQLLRQIREIDPERPSTRIAHAGEETKVITKSLDLDSSSLGKAIGGDLDWIVMKAMEKDRDRRYESTSEFAADVRRFLNHEPVSAAPPSKSYLIRKFVRRHKTGVAAAAVMLVLFVAGSVGTLIGWYRTNEALANEGIQRGLAEDNAARAGVAENLAREEAKRATEAESVAKARAAELELVADFRANQLNEVDPELMGQRLQTAMLTAIPEELAESFSIALSELDFTGLALDSLESNLFGNTVEAIDAEFAGQPELQAMMFLSLGVTLREVGLWEVATYPLERSLLIRRESLGDDHDDTQVSLTELGLHMTSLRRYEEAEAYYEEALDWARRTHGDEHLETYIALMNLGGMWDQQGMSEQAEEVLQVAVAGMRETVGDEDEFTLAAIVVLANTLDSLDRLEECEPLYREAVASYRKVLGEDHQRTISALGDLATHRSKVGDFEEANQLQEESLARVRRVLGDNHPNTVTTMNEVATNYLRQKLPDKAEPYLEIVIEKRRERYGESDYRTLNANSNMAYVRRLQWRLLESESLMLETHALASRSLGPDHDLTRRQLRNHGRMLRDEVRALDEEGNQVDLGDGLARLGIHYLAFDSIEDAEGTLREAWEMLSNSLLGDDPRTWIAMNALGEALGRGGSFDEAEPLLCEGAGWILENTNAQTEVPARFYRTYRESIEAVIQFYRDRYEVEPNSGADASASGWEMALQGWLDKSE